MKCFFFFFILYISLASCSLIAFQQYTDNTCTTRYSSPIYGPTRNLTEPLVIPIVGQCNFCSGFNKLGVTYTKADDTGVTQCDHTSIVTDGPTCSSPMGACVNHALDTCVESCGITGKAFGKFIKVPIPGIIFAAIGSNQFEILKSPCQSDIFSVAWFARYYYDTPPTCSVNADCNVERVYTSLPPAPSTLPPAGSTCNFSPETTCVAGKCDKMLDCMNFGTINQCVGTLNPFSKLRVPHGITVGTGTSQPYYMTIMSDNLKENIGKFPDRGGGSKLSVTIVFGIILVFILA